MSRRLPAQIQAQGFTLIEVMVALFVVAVALPALMFQLGTQLSSTGVLRDKTLASWVAQDQLAIHRLQSAGNASGELQGERLLAEREWPWLLSTETTPVPGMVRQTLRVYPDVTARQRQRDAIVEMTVYARTGAVSGAL
ncbi:type II secretion system minor pseudopilin GspI [Pseudohongiella sp.]|uniref:Type II secretion system protein GspI C-terminal domain-containing protein n=1 Tax=marine sediment metagenome TaxID=412755 RepID=A0A0F9Y0J6_9ZZZZ|nr:type II secretion system minor pseudopilin GspI [Pseudohongiella sp.]HDZ10507.1 type II secretion system protein GspI [Pseudohongiella sp.]HEA63858.1 type II secretion system protein GspI [Pseudohongiella sp.]